MLSPRGARGVEKAELNGNVDSDNNHGGSSTAYVLHRLDSQEDNQLLASRMRAAEYARDGGSPRRELEGGEGHDARCQLRQGIGSWRPRRRDGEGEGTTQNLRPFWSSH